MSSTYIKTGLGGAGNYRPASSIGESIHSPLLPAKARSMYFSSGIGGAGNHHHNKYPSRSSLKCHPASQPGYLGIGGAGNRNLIHSTFAEHSHESSAIKMFSRLKSQRRSSASSMSGSESGDSSLKTKIVDLKNSFCWRSNRIIECGLDEAMEGGNPGYTQIEI